jgi:hypothetical protein
MTPAQELHLKTMYEQDSSFAYECSSDELNFLIGVFGEMEPIIDAMNVSCDASIEQRARDIGCHPDDFRWESEAEVRWMNQVISGVIDL